MKLIRDASNIKKLGTIFVGVSSSLYAPQLSTSFEYSEDVVFNKQVNISHQTAEYLDSFKKNTLGSNFYLKYRFEIHYQNWKKKTQLFSSISRIIDNADFQSMVEIGKESIGIILEKIEEEPSTLVWAMNIITESRISKNPTITITDACKLWVKWGKENNIL